MSIYIPGAGVTIEQYRTPTGVYEGVVVEAIPEGLVRVSDPAVCYVSGSGPNIFGHALFMISRSIGYVHAADPGVKPTRFIPHDEYDRYLRETGKVSWNMLPAKLANPSGAENYIRNAMLNGFNWQPHHNCVTFCTAVLQAGGSNVTPNSVLPSTATQQQGTVRTPAHQHPYDAIGNDDL